MRALEVVSAILAETIIEMGIVILTDPPEIHWSKEMIMKPPPAPRGRKGKKVDKNAHDIYGKIVADLAPSVPTDSKKQSTTSKKGTFKTPVKTKQQKKGTDKISTQSMQVESNDDVAEVTEGQADIEVQGQHKGLPVQGRRGKNRPVLIYLTIPCVHLQSFASLSLRST